MNVNICSVVQRKRTRIAWKYGASLACGQMTAITQIAARKVSGEPHGILRPFGTTHGPN